MTALLNPRWARCLLPQRWWLSAHVSIAILFSTLGASGQGSPSSAQRTVALRPLSGTFNEVLWSAFNEAYGGTPLRAEALGVPSALVANSLWPDLRQTVEDATAVSWPKVFVATNLGALAGYAVSWRLLKCGFDERDGLCSGNNDLLLVPMILTPVVSVSGAAMLVGADSWRSVGGTTLGILGSGLVYVLGFASDLPHPAIVGLAGLTHAGITTLVVIR